MAAAQPPAPRMGSEGDSKAWRDNKKSAGAMLEAFLRDTTHELFRGKDFAAFTEQEWTHTDLYACFVQYMFDMKIPEGRSNAGDPYQAGTIINYLQILAGKAETALTQIDTPTAKLFMTFKDPNAKTEAARWFKGLKTQTLRQCFQREMKAGTAGSSKTKPLGLSNVTAILKAYHLAGTKEATMRARSICGLWQGAGRASELKYVRF